MLNKIYQKITNKNKVKELEIELHKTKVELKFAKSQIQILQSLITNDGMINVKELK